MANIEPSEDELILDALRKRPGLPTYVVANSIGARGQTARIRRRLRRLEEHGLVRSGSDIYATMICWWAR
ncbi:hypothetical protein [Phenylobacterium sp.]|uniref:hypothetical protein n=1 Tax=Phenylobacterium sp. TaxID=1871053 RepID=UPI00301E3064